MELTSPAPASFRQKARGVKWEIRQFKQAARRLLAALFDSSYWASDGRLLKLRDQYRGQQCVIIGNGPSLRKTNMPLLKGRHTFGMNRIYLGLEDFGFTPSFYVCVNNLVLEQCWDEIVRLPMLKFLSSRCGTRDSGQEDLIYLRTNSTQEMLLYFSGNPFAGIWEGHTVTYVAMQLAFWMGFQKVMLVGVDHSFATKGEPNKEIVSQEGDPNHFSPKYFDKGFRWHLPDLEGSETAYHMARYAFGKAGREIVDCTVGGQLQVFRKSLLEVELAP